MGDDLFSNSQKLSVRVPKEVDKFIEKLSVQNNKTKQEVLSEAVIQILPNDLKILIGDEKYKKIFNKIKGGLMQISDEDFFLLFKLKIQNKREYELALEFYNLAYKDENLGVVKRNNWLRLLTLKECYIEQLKCSICEDNEIRDKLYTSIKELKINL